MAILFFVIQRRNLQNSANRTMFILKRGKGKKDNSTTIRDTLLMLGYFGTLRAMYNVYLRYIESN
jgi:hypothetical protein